MQVQYSGDLKVDVGKVALWQVARTEKFEK